jgi:hypothetical protein
MQSPLQYIVWTQIVEKSRDRWNDASALSPSNVRLRITSDVYNAPDPLQNGG